MKLLHTADWHLGQKFFHEDRQKEHQAALDWLAHYIIKEEVELLVVAGDIFDTDSPPNYARKLYFDFLKKLIHSCCKDIVIIAGNHDSANMLEASKELFKLLNVHVVGSVSENRAEQIIEIRDAKNVLKAVVGAVPYLRDKDIRKSVSGESYEERVESLRLGVQQHYAEMETALQPYQKENVPIIVTGHLYAAGGQRDDRPNSIHIGSLDIIEADSFSTDFDYVALGHLHRCQQIGKNRPIWYSGALIPLDFTELKISQVVRLVEFDKKNIIEQKNVKVPLIRQLVHLQGTLDTIKEKLLNLDTAVELSTWLKIEVETETYSPDLEGDLREIIARKPAEIMTLNQKNIGERKELDELYRNLQSLQDLEEVEVFRMCAQQKGQIQTEQMSDLEASFTELLGWMQEKEID